jgi:hypothetical protein
LILGQLWVHKRVRVNSKFPSTGPDSRVLVQVPQYGSHNRDLFRSKFPSTGPGSQVRVQVKMLAQYRWDIGYDPGYLREYLVILNELVNYYRFIHIYHINGRKHLNFRWVKLYKVCCHFELVLVIKLLLKNLKNFPSHAYRTSAYNTRLRCICRRFSASFSLN